jgi:hypothetical protein
MEAGARGGPKGKAKSKSKPFLRIKSVEELWSLPLVGTEHFVVRQQGNFG